VKSHLKRCPVCYTYTLKARCPRCDAKTVAAHPPKFSPDDKYFYMKLREYHESLKKEK
jgi:H/ACA ribonucleoprotein complex subunit 3